MKLISTHFLHVSHLIKRGEEEDHQNGKAVSVIWVAAEQGDRQGAPNWTGFLCPLLSPPIHQLEEPLTFRTATLEKRRHKSWSYVTPFSPCLVSFLLPHG